MIDEFDITIKKAEDPLPDFHKQIVLLAQTRQDRMDLEREYDAVLGRIQMLKNLEKKLDEDLRAMALEHYEKTGETQPHEAIKIKTMKRYYYDEAENLRLAIEHGEHSLLKLDTSAIRRCEADWVVVEEKMVPTPNVQSRLGEYLIRSENA